MGLVSLAADQLRAIGDLVPLKQRFGLLQLAKPIRANLVADGWLLEEINIPDWSSRAGPADVVRLMRLLSPGRVRALRVGYASRLDLVVGGGWCRLTPTTATTIE